MVAIPPTQKKTPLCVPKMALKNISMKITMTSGGIIVAKCQEIEMKETITLMKHVNKPVMNKTTIQQE